MHYILPSLFAAMTTTKSYLLKLHFYFLRTSALHEQVRHCTRFVVSCFHFFHFFIFSFFISPATFFGDEYAGFLLQYDG